MREIKSGLKSAQSCSEEHSRRVPGIDACVREELAWEGEVLPPRPTGGFFEGICERVDRRFEQDS